MRHPLVQLFLARLREFYRQPETIFWVYGFPLIMAVGLGIAFWNREPEPTPVDVIRSGDPARDDALRTHLDTAGMTTSLHDEAEAQKRLRVGKSALFVTATADGVRYTYDPTRPESAAARLQVDAAVTRWRAGVAVADEDGASDADKAAAHKVGEATWRTADVFVREPGSRYIDFLIPGLVGMNIMGGGLFGVGFVLVDMRVRKLLKRLLATPMRQSHFLGSIMTTRLALLLPEMALLLAAAVLLVNVPVRGGYGLLTLTILVGAFAFSGLGLLLASRAQTIETISGLLNLVMMPSWLLSGTFFSSKRFPDAVQPFIQALPLTQLNDALREVMLEGATLGQVGWRLGVLSAWGGVTFLLALKWFRWR